MPNCQVFPPAFIELVGCDVEPGSIVAAALIDEDVSFTDITDPSEWTTGLTYSSDIIIFQEVRGSYAKPAVTEIPGKGAQDTRVVGRKHEVIFRVESVKNNDNFWNTVNRSTNYTFAFVVGIDYGLLMRVTKNVSIDAAAVVQEATDSIVEWEVSVKWSDINVPSTSNVPTGIFN